jgi:secreted trypsin-like serine protease
MSFPMPLPKPLLPAVAFFSFLVAFGGLSSSARGNSSILAYSILGSFVVSPADPITSSTVLLRMSGRRRVDECSASIIAPDLLLTAAHCVLGFRPKDIEVLSMHRGISAYRIHPAYVMPEPVKAAWNDIAVLRLSGTLPPGFKPVAHIAGLETVDTGVTANDLSSGEPVTIAGFGISDYTNARRRFRSVGTLRKAILPLYHAVYHDSEMVLDQSEHGGTCDGDSGGPAFVSRQGQPVLVGVASSSGEGCDSYSIYTRIDRQLEFVKRAISELRNQ